MRVGNLQRNTRESGAGTDVADHNRFGVSALRTPYHSCLGKFARQKERFPEMSYHDSFRITNGSKVHLRIPAQQKIDVTGHLIQLDGRQIVDIWTKQGGQVHGAMLNRRRKSTAKN